MWAGIASRRQFFFQLAHHRLRTAAQPPRRVAHPTAIQGQVRNFRAYARFVHFLAVTQLERAPTRRTAVALGTIGRLAVAVNSLRLLTGRADNGF